VVSEDAARLRSACGRPSARRRRDDAILAIAPTGHAAAYAGICSPAPTPRSPRSIAPELTHGDRHKALPYCRDEPSH
jgi:hypothetical protein